EEERDCGSFQRLDRRHLEAARLHDVGHAEDRAAFRMAFDQAVEHVHVAVGQGGLLGGDHVVRAAQLVARLGRDVQGHDLVELVADPASRVAARSRIAGVVQAEIGLHPLVAGTGADDVVLRQQLAQGRLDPASVATRLARPRARTLEAPALPRPRRAAEEVDRTDKHDAGNDDRDPQHPRVGHSLSPQAAPARRAASARSTETRRLTPGSRMVTPDSCCAASIVALLWVTNRNCTCSLISLTIAVKRPTLASSSGASTSSSRQNGAGLRRKIANTRATAVIAFSPPDSSEMLDTRLPGGRAMIATPVSSRSSPVSSR